MQNFGQHGRELITNEVALKLLQLLAHDTELVKFCALQDVPAARLLASLKHVVMKVRECISTRLSTQSNDTLKKLACHAMQEHDLLSTAEPASSTGRHQGVAAPA